MTVSEAAGRVDPLRVEGMQPSDENAEKCVRIDKNQRVGLEILLEAHDHAVELNRGVWDFAVELAELRRAGLRNADVRCLLCKGLVGHAHEKRSPDPDRREFRRDCGLLFRKKSCFMLTEAGVAAARCVSSGLAENVAPPDGPVAARRVSLPSCSDEPVVPRWDSDRQQLRLGNEIVKEFKVPAPNQEQILAAFEEEGWPVHIDDPLPPRPEQDPKQRLHTTVNALNRNQRNRRIRFHGDGRGEGVRWGLVAPGENGRENGHASANSIP